jgi:hypothetical protein
LEELKEAVKYHDIFKAYSLGVTLFESYAVKILHEDFDMNNVHVGKDIMDRINVQTLIVILYTNKIITKSEYDDMIKINSIRNNLIIHKDFTKELDVGTLLSTTNYINKILIYAHRLKSIYWSKMAFH